MAQPVPAAGRNLLGLTPPGLGPAVILGSLALNLLALAMPLVTLQIFDRIIPNAAHATLAVLFAGLCCVAAMELALRLARIHLVGQAGAHFERALAERMFDHSLDAVPRDYERDTTGAHFERFGAIAQLREHYSGQGRLLAIDVPFTAIFVGMIALIGGWLVAVPIGVLALLFAGGMIGRSRQAAVLATRKAVDGRRYSFLIEFLVQIATVKSARMEPQMLRRYEMLNRQSVAASRDLIRLSGLTQGFGAVIGQASVAAMGLAGGFLVIDGRIGVGDLAACMLLNGRTTQPMLRLLGLLGQGESVAQARHRVAEIAALPRRPPPPRVAVPLRGEITLDRVAFRHPGSGEMVFDGFDGRIAPGECVALHGRDAGGRSSLMRMILGEQPPSAGRVLVDGVPAHRRAAARGPGGIVLVDSAPLVFRGTIFENLSLFGLVADRDLIRSTAGATGIEEDVRALPFGYQTMLSPQGAGFSRGFLQRLCVTRALCLQPAILMLNNATSATDSTGLARVAEALRARRGGATLLVVSAQAEIAGLAARSLDLGTQAARAAIARWEADRRAEAEAARFAARQTA